MEAVRAFNNELSSLYEGRPPVSRAKMANVTKNAIKAIKFYKHVVQSVEKFIQKCKPEYKVPGLYVIDSIVRQSRHQFGPEKDVFSPRFTKNIVHTFTNLLKCPPEERSRLVRVLNLWQKNSVFPVDVIQPLLDLAADPNNTELVTAAQKSVDGVVSVTQKVPLPGTHSSSNGAGGDSSSNQLLQQKDMLSTITKLLQQAQDGSISATAPESQLAQLQHLQQQLVMQTERISKPQQSAPPIDSNLLAQIQTLTNQLLSKTGSEEGTGVGDSRGRSVKTADGGFNKKLLDFDYGESDDEDDHQQDMHHHQQHHQQHNQQHNQQPLHNQKMPLHQQMMLPGGLSGLLDNPNMMPPMPPMPPHPQDNFQNQEQMRQRFLEQQQQEFDREIGQSAMMDQNQPQDMMLDNNGQDDREDERDSRERDRRRHRSKEISRSPRRRRRSRSRSRDRRRRSRSRDRFRRSRSRDRGSSRRDNREKERERRKAGLPPLKDNCISVCTTTLWFGHVTKHTTEEELREHIERYGTIKTINMIPPRGCAFVCLTKRKDAFKALDRLKGVKVNGNALKVAWAPGIGVKESMFKDLWDVEQGVTQIPWDQLPMDIRGLLAGGMVDEDSLPPRLKGMKSGEEDENDQSQSGSGNPMMPGNEDMVMPPRPPEQQQQQQQQQQHQQQQQQQQQMMMGIQGQSNFPGPMQGGMPNQQGPMGMMGLQGPPGMMGGGPPMGMRPGGPMPGQMGGQNMGMNMNAGGPQPSNMGGMPPNLGGGNRMMGPGGMGMGMRPGLPPSPMQGGMMDKSPGQMGGQPRMDGSRGGMGPMGGMNNFNNRPPFPMSRFPPMQGRGNPPLPFFNNMNNNDRRDPMGDSDMRTATETKEWPPDDEMNAEDEDSDPMDSDERMLPPMQQQQQGMPGLRPMGGGGHPGGPFRPRGPMLQGLQGPHNPMMANINMSRAQSPNTAIPSMLSLRMMQSSRQQPVLGLPGAGPSAAALTLAQNLAHAGIRIPLPGMNMTRPPGMVPNSTPQRMLPQSPGAGMSVSVGLNNGPMVVSGLGGGGIPSINIGSRPSPQRSPSPDMPPPSSLSVDNSNSPQTSRPGGGGLDGPIPLMQVQGGGGGGNQPSGGTVLGRGFSPMTIRPRGGAGLLGVRPGAQTAGFVRFGAPRPLLGPAFGNFERPVFGNRMGGPIRPRLPGFFDEDKDERRLQLQKLDIDERSGPGDIDERTNLKDVDERRASGEEEPSRKDNYSQDSINAENKESTRPSGRKSRWSNAVDDSSNSNGMTEVVKEPVTQAVIEPIREPVIEHVSQAASESEPHAIIEPEPQAVIEPEPQAEIEPEPQAVIERVEAVIEPVTEAQDSSEDFAVAPSEVVSSVVVEKEPSEPERDNRVAVEQEPTIDREEEPTEVVEKEEAAVPSTELTVASDETKSEEANVESTTEQSEMENDNDVVEDS